MNTNRVDLQFEDNDGLAGIPEYLARHKTYCEQLNTITKELSSTELIETKGHQLLKQLPIIQQQTGTRWHENRENCVRSELMVMLFVVDYVYEELLKFSIEKLPTKAKRPPLLRQESIHLSPKKRLPHDPRTGKGKMAVSSR